MRLILTMTLSGEPRTKKNSQRIIRIGRGFRIMPSKAFTDYERTCVMQIAADMRLCIAERVNVKCVYFMPTHRRVDLTNLLEATDDILVDAGVLADDHCGIIRSHDGSRVEYDKHYPRVEITIERSED